MKGDVIALVDAVTAQSQQILVERSAVGGDHAAFRGGDDFDRMKGKNGHIRISAAADRSAIVICGAQCVCRVFNHDAVKPVGDFADRRHVARHSRKMDRNDGLDLLEAGARPGQFPGIEIQRLGIDV